MLRLDFDWHFVNIGTKRNIRIGIRPVWRFHIKRNKIPFDSVPESKRVFGDTWGRNAISIGYLKIYWHTTIPKKL